MNPLELVEVRGLVERWGEDPDSRTVAGEGQVESAGDSGLAEAVMTMIDFLRQLEEQATVPWNDASSKE